MGSSNFYDCKNLSDNNCMNSSTLEEIKNMICPVNNPTISSRREFLSNSSNNNLTITDHIKKQAVNKIIKAYREYKINQEEKLKINIYNNNNKINEEQNEVEENNDINKLKNKIKNKINFLQNEISENDKEENSLEDNNDFFKTHESKNCHNNQNQENPQFNSHINDNNQNNKNQFLKIHDNSSERVKNSLASIKTIYIGEGNKDQKEGFGINKWGDEAKYIGYYKNNKAEGYGKFIAGNDIYKGEFKDDTASGYGIFDNGDMTYEGYWVKELQEIYGIEKWKDGAMYRGEYSKGIKSGIGTYTWGDGTKYEGMWANNTFNGFGIFYYSNDRFYFGEWKDKKRDGFGEFIWPEKKYIGFFSEDKKEGFGILIWKNGKKGLIGFWKDGKQIGFGKFMNKKKVFYGLWKQNNKVDWINTEDDKGEYLENNEIKKYKNFFDYDLEQLYDFCYNKNEIENILNEQDKTKNDEFNN